MSKSYISRELRERVAVAAQRRCGYCLSSEEIVGSTMEIDHLVPESRGGPTEEENLWLACPICNGFKSDRFPQLIQRPATSSACSIHANSDGRIISYGLMVANKSPD